ncbi:hypothetical protein [Frankia gtarii]|uniref:hypothetical protein n=1 Tax=Frankia gtarii TaxID=2950102 RepID=UPI0021BFE37A|nr:hypothetical protein [Frankia gtarii]
MVYLSRRRRRRRRMRFSVFALLVWLLGVAAAHGVTMLVAYATVALVAITVDLAANRRRRLPPRGRRRRAAATARPGSGTRPVRRAGPGGTSHRPRTTT